MQTALALPTPRRLPPVGLMPPAGDPVGALRRLVSRYTPTTREGQDYAILDPLAWREALAEYAPLLAEHEANGYHPLPLPRRAVLAHLHRFELFHIAADPRTGGPLVPLYMVTYAATCAANLARMTPEESPHG